MRIVNAKPAPEYIRLPAPVLDAYLAGRIGKGELATAAHLYRYLWGHQRPIEGTTADFCDILGLPERTVQRHLVMLGQTGCVLCSRPQHGHWILNTPSGTGNPPKLAAPVVVINSLQEDMPDPEKQQQLLTAHDPPVLAGSTAGTPNPGALAELLRAGLQTDIAADLAARHPPDRIHAVIHAAANRAQTNPAGWIRQALEQNWPLPSNGRRRRRHPDAYTVTKYGDGIIKT